MNQGNGLSRKRIDDLITIYRDGLLEDTVPFWIRHSVDREQGGFIFCLDRDGTILDTDKGMWIQSRFTWLLSTLYAEVEARPEWLELARHGLDFVERYGFDRDGKMFFQVTREGKPLRKRRYLATEGFAVIAYAAYGRAAGDERAIDRAFEMTRYMRGYAGSPAALSPKVIPDTRMIKSIGSNMMRIYISQIMRQARPDPVCNEWIDEAIREVRQDFIHDDKGWILEHVGPEGEFLDHFDGRMVNPGHLIEVAWFILHEARVRDRDPDLIKLGCKMLDWAWEIGWDREYGGIFYFRDVNGLPCTEYYHDMKFWWPQNETIIATLLAYHLTGDPKYAKWHEQLHDWVYSLFPDPEYGEWFGYFHRDGRLLNTIKGNLWKGPFHIPRMQLYAWKLLEEMREQTG
ncbi:MAG: N-acylglucosamine 2-epimerase [Spirochaetaceae bacterium]|nr:MAG: N-acylglucosamine 2-epimerase [Spirochaetaceae bacterium]